ncbi:MAG TPA: VWA domain-containing protein [Candidatus Limnocylindrales bacterium]|nr:VWA domain-containing protein [Candidatus Limnocylindrales bacterium]
MRCAISGLAAFCLLTFSLAKEAQKPIRVDVNLVNVAFTARDANGALIGNLTKDDVELYEDAVPQKIEFFAKSTDLPLTLALIMDVSGSQEHFEKKHHKDLEVFLKEVLGPKDRAFMVCFGNHLRLVSDYTNSPEAILDNFHEFDKGKRHFPEIGPEEERELGTAFYDSIYYSVTEKLAQAGGRQAILMFSDGEDNSSSNNMMTAIEASQAANVIFYAIRYTETNKHGSLNARNKYGISVMDRIAKETGGAHIDAQRTDPHAYFRQLAEELRTSYELAYYPSNKAKDDAFRKIVIKPKQAGTIIRAKTGYFSR